MENCIVSELVFINQYTSLMDCPSEGSGDPDCGCDGVDGS